MTSLENLPDDSDLYDVLLAFDRALGDAPPGERGLLRRWTARFPRLAGELEAAGYARFALGRTLTDDVEEAEWEPEAAAETTAAKPPLTSLLAEAQARGLDAAGFAQALRLDRVLVARLNQRALDAASLPRALVASIAGTLGRSSGEVAAFLRGGPRLAAAAHYRARRAPSLVAESGAARPSFADALTLGTKMTGDDLAYWRAEIENGVWGEDEGTDSTR